MSQVAIGDVSSGSFDAASGTISHIVASGEGLLVLVTLGVVDAAKEIASVAWDAAGVNQALAIPAAVAPFDAVQHNKRLEAWWLAAPTAKTALVTVTIEGGNTQKTGVTCVSLANVHATTPFTDRTTLDSASVTTPSVVITQGANDLGIMVLTHELKDSAMSPQSGEVEQSDLNVAGDYRHAVYSEDATGDITIGATSAGGAGKAGVLGFCIEEAVVAGGQAPRSMHQIRMRSA